MLKRQDEVLKDWKVVKEEPFSQHDSAVDHVGPQDPTAPVQPQESNGSVCQDAWESDDSVDDLTHSCAICGSVVPLFAVTAHDRYHSMTE